MNERERQPGAIDDPGVKGGVEPEVDLLPPASGSGGMAEPKPAELDLPGPDDPVAWNYVESETLVVGPDGEELGRVAAMLGSEPEGIFHGVAVTPYADGTTRVVPADAVDSLTTAAVRIAYDADQLAAAEPWSPVTV
jgi:hypothetical protein